MLKGFDGAKTTSIAHAAGVTHAMLHYYSERRNSCSSVFYRESTIDERVGSGCFRSTGLPLLERLKDGVTCHFDFIAANPQLPRFIVNEVLAVLNDINL